MHRGEHRGEHRGRDGADERLASAAAPFLLKDLTLLAAALWTAGEAIGNRTDAVARE